MNPSTSTDPGARTGWHIEDRVIRLREWGSERVYGLPDLPAEWTIGSASTCELHLRDAPSQISRRHARLMPCDDGWKIQDLNSKNGLWRDGARQLEFTLTPGLEIGIGSLRLVAESRRLIGLHALLCRLLGWSAPCQDGVDEALRSLREWAALRVALILIGDGDLSSVARRLHAAALGPGAPFVAADEHAGVAAALPAAAHGTLWAPELPSDLEVAAARLRDARDRTRLVLRAHTADDAARVALALSRAAIIALPPLAARDAELPRLIDECADDAAAALGAPTPGLTMADLAVLARLPYRGIADLEHTVRRLVALRTWGVSNGATRLGISHVALLRWAQRRGLET